MSANPHHSFVVPHAVVGLLLLSAVACGTSDTTSPSVTNGAPGVGAPAQPSHPTNFPAPTGPARVFAYDHAFWAPQAYTTQSRFVLYDNHAFALQYPPPIGEYRGGYTETNAGISFDWEGWSSAGPWWASGTLSGDTLTVRYNMIMALSDFEDAVYTLVR
ncbi:MAG TPA: hypothetical protein VM099_06955 [Gemmatimonadaceae bacterium]|nr:hypothetical protein [Gemmatimonadaceae bacterium]